MKRGCGWCLDANSRSTRELRGRPTSAQGSNIDRGRSTVPLKKSHYVSETRLSALLLVSSGALSLPAGVDFGEFVALNKTCDWNRGAETYVRREAAKRNLQAVRSSLASRYELLESVYCRGPGWSCRSWVTKRN